MSDFNPSCYYCGKLLKTLGLNSNGFVKFKKCNCLKNKQNGKNQGDK